MKKPLEHRDSPGLYTRPQGAEKDLSNVIDPNVKHIEMYKLKIMQKIVNGLTF